VIAEVNISYDTLENNIEGGNLHNTIISMIAERARLLASKAVASTPGCKIRWPNPIFSIFIESDVIGT
jgi:hypothetical protein